MKQQELNQISDDLAYLKMKHEKLVNEASEIQKERDMVSERFK